MGIDDATSDFAKEFPALAEFLLVDHWDERTPRQTGMLMIFGEGGRIKVAVLDRDAGRTCWLTCDEVYEQLQEIEARLVADALDWRQQGRKGVKR